MNEIELLNRIRPTLPTNPNLIAGAGDDCAVIALPASEDVLLLKTDAVVEGVHFLPDTRPDWVGRKALARCLSDIAAMAGRPDSVLVSMGLPQDYDVDYVMSFYSGLNELARAYGCSVSGGETTQSAGGYWFSITLTGFASKGRVVLRSGARPGDALFVTGELGGSRAGKHLHFEPRIKEAQWLIEHFEIHSMIDLSDGLGRDLRHLIESSGVGVEVMNEAVPISKDAKRIALESKTGMPGAIQAAWNDGEDFELLFTVDKSVAVSLLDAFREAFPQISISCIGRITGDKGLHIRNKEGREVQSGHGYIHFENP